MMLQKYLLVFLVSMVPMIELRGAVLLAPGLDLPMLPSYIVCILGNMLPVPFIYLFARKVLTWGAGKPVIGRFFPSKPNKRWREVQPSVFRRRPSAKRSIRPSFPTGRFRQATATFKARKITHRGGPRDLDCPLRPL